MSDERSPSNDLVRGVLVVRRGPGANCSSIGSAVEMLFLSATAGAALLSAVTAALGPRTGDQDDDDTEDPDASAGSAAGEGAP